MNEIEVYPCVCECIPEVKSLLDENHYFYVSCAKCRKNTKPYYSMKRAIKEWNKWMKQLYSVKYITVNDMKGGME